MMLLYGQEKGNPVIIAQQWTTFDIAADPEFRVEVLMGHGDGSDDRRLGVVGAKRMNESIEKLGKALATTEIEDLASGFHIVIIPLQMDMPALDMPRGKGGTRMLTAIATAEPDVVELLNLKDDKTATSKLQVEAWKVFSQT